MSKIPKLVRNDEWLMPYVKSLMSRIDHMEEKEKELVQEGQLSDFATGYLYFGLHATEKGWIIREWAPNATHIHLIGAFTLRGNGVWELFLDKDEIHHGDLYALSVHWAVNFGKRIPAWSRRVVQDENTHIFNAQVWHPETSYKWECGDFKGLDEPPIIYEAHVGMAGEDPRVHTYKEFTQHMLPRIKANGYNTIQLMAIQEHPYYGSFGYHVSSFFAPSSRFGTPEELKELIDTAHEMGMAVIMDIVHSHAVKNEVEGLGNFDGTRFQFFHDGPKGEHPAWDSYCFNYGKNEVLHFLLSNIKYWLDEFKFDGFRFDGVTSMLYYDHGLEKAFRTRDLARFIVDQTGKSKGLFRCGRYERNARTVRST